ncbi:MAG TPA: peptidoglycan-binding domain-containing protein, partial [Bacteroidia bacterium]|nr:peptidoglycan-binding domain-containing protein [Bacteroidia bacterium]
FLNGPYQTYNPAARREILKIVQVLLGSGLDGQMGSRTQEAILDFQTQERLVPTGLLDSPTIALLGLEGIEEDNVVAPPPGVGRPLVRRAAGGPSINFQKVSRVPGKVVRKAGKKIRRLLR